LEQYLPPLPSITPPDHFLYVCEQWCVKREASKAFASGLPNRKSAAVCEITSVFAA